MAGMMLGLPIDVAVRDNYVMPPARDRLRWSYPLGDVTQRVNSRFRISCRGQVMELSNYELVRYPSGQLVITRKDAKNAGFRDIVGVFASEAEALRMLDRLNSGELVAQPQLALAG
jgi:hypothetical protein